MNKYINAQIGNKIGGSVTNHVTGSGVLLEKAPSDSAINTQIDSLIRGDVTNTFDSSVSSDGEIDKKNNAKALSFLKHVWGAIPGLNAAIQIFDKILYLFKH
jgi:hypothetical protein